MKLHEAIGLELERREMEITFEFACRDDCLGKMVPSDLRQVVAERDRLRERNEALEKAGKPARTLVLLTGTSATTSRTALRRHYWEVRDE